MFQTLSNYNLPRSEVKAEDSDDDKEAEANAGRSWHGPLVVELGSCSFRIGPLAFNIIAGFEEGLHDLENHNFNK